MLIGVLVLSCKKSEKYDQELERKLNLAFDVPFGITKLLWEECYRLDLDIAKDRTEFIKDPESVFLYTYTLAQKGFSYNEVCQVYFQMSDTKGLWFVGSILKESFTDSENVAHLFHEISFSEDIKEHACEFYKENAKERAFLVCAKHIELKKLFIND